MTVLFPLHSNEGIRFSFSSLREDGRAVSAASHLRCFLALFVLFLCSVVCENNVKSTVVYDFHTLLNIRISVIASLAHRPEQRSSHRALHQNIPGEIWAPSCCCPKARRTRRRGKRAGVAVRIRKKLRAPSNSMDTIHVLRLSCLRLLLPASPAELPAFAPGSHRRPHTRVASVPACTGPRTTIAGEDLGQAAMEVASVPARRLSGDRPRCLRPLPRASTFGRAGSDLIHFGLLNARSIANKSFILNDLFDSLDLDFMLITETWQKTDEFTSLNELCPQNCSFSCVPRATGRGGGLASIHRDCFSSRTVSSRAYSTFEVLINKVGRTNPFYSVLIYRPPGRNGSFLTEFGDFLPSIIRLDRILLSGDFNIHINKNSDNFATDFLNITDSFQFTQHVTGPTHVKGNTLDLVFTFGLNVCNVHTEDLLVTDHRGVLFSVSFDNDFLPKKRLKSSRIVNSAAVAGFTAAFDSNVLFVTR